MGQWRWGQALIGAAIWLVSLGLVWFITGGNAMGFGDVKLAPVLGLSLGWCGWDIATFGLFCAWFLGGIVAGVLILFGRARRSSAIAFGPFLIAGFWVALIFGPELVRGLSTGQLV
jgi:leader peptidase (prepilin peptidase)/N-methyltransferase